MNRKIRRLPPEDLQLQADIQIRGALLIGETEQSWLLLRNLNEVTCTKKLDYLVFIPIVVAYIKFLDRTFQLPLNLAGRVWSGILGRLCMTTSS